MTVILVIAVLGAIAVGGYYVWMSGKRQSPYVAPPPPPPPPPSEHRSNVADVIIAGFNAAPGIIGAINR